MCASVLVQWDCVRLKKWDGQGCVAQRCAGVSPVWVECGRVGVVGHVGRVGPPSAGVGNRLAGKWRVRLSV